MEQLPDRIKDQYEIKDSSDFGNAKIFSEVVLKNYETMALPVAPPRLNERLSVQQGLFLCPGDVNVSFMDNIYAYETNSIRKNLVAFVIPNALRIEALRDLKSMNISRTSLFPGMDGFSADLARSLELLQNSPEFGNTFIDPLPDDFHLDQFSFLQLRRSIVGALMKR